MSFLAIYGEDIKNEFLRLFAKIEDPNERGVVTFKVLVNLDPDSSINKGTESEAARQLRFWCESDGFEGWSPEEIIEKTSEQMNPTKNQELRRLFNSRMNEKIVVKDNEIYSCRNKSCGSKKVMTYDMQIARIDEPNNVKVYCTQCYSSYII